MESREVLIKELQMIKKWEEDQTGLCIWDRLGRLPFKILDRLTPRFVHNKLGSLLDEIGGYIQTGGSYLVNEKTVFNSIQAEAGYPITNVTDVQSIFLRTMEKVSHQLI